MPNDIITTQLPKPKNAVEAVLALAKELSVHCPESDRAYYERLHAFLTQSSDSVEQNAQINSVINLVATLVANMPKLAERFTEVTERAQRERLRLQALEFLATFGGKEAQA